MPTYTLTSLLLCDQITTVGGKNRSHESRSAVAVKTAAHTEVSIASVREILNV
jgi:hypothetical protein